VVVSVRDGATNRRLLRELLDDPAVLDGTADTRWLDGRSSGNRDTLAGEALAVAAVLVYREEGAQALRTFYESVARGVPQSLPEAEGRDIRVCGRSMRVYCVAYNRYEVEGVEIGLTVEEPGAGQVEIAGQRYRLLYHLDPAHVDVELDTWTHRLSRSSGGLVRSPAPALVMEIAVAEGDVVESGQRLCTLEAMKMEMPLYAATAGRVVTVYRSPGAQVAAGHPLVLIEADTDDQTADAGPALPPAPSTDRVSGLADVVREARRILLGYDIDTERAEALFDRLDNGPITAGEGSVDNGDHLADLGAVTVNRLRSDPSDDTDRRPSGVAEFVPLDPLPL